MKLLLMSEYILLKRKFYIVWTAILPTHKLSTQNYYIASCRLKRATSNYSTCIGRCRLQLLRRELCWSIKSLLRPALKLGIYMPDKCNPSDLNSHEIALLILHLIHFPNPRTNQVRTMKLDLLKFIRSLDNFNCLMSLSQCLKKCNKLGNNFIKWRHWDFEIPQFSELI